MALSIFRFIFSISVLYLLLRWFRNRKHIPLPPGPTGIPLLGNLKDLPTPGELESQHWVKHKYIYGPISSVTVMGTTLIIINDPKIAFELLEERSSKHSSRPKQIFAGEMVGWANSLGLSPYNNRFRTLRKNISKVVGSKGLASHFNTLQEAEVGHLLLHLLAKPEELLEHIKREAGAVILNIAYGYTAEPKRTDPLVFAANDAMEKFARAAVPGAFLVDVLPFLRYVPDWIPGAGFKKTGRAWARQLISVTEKPYEFVKHQIAQGEGNVSLLAQLLQHGDESAEEQRTNKWSAMSLYTAGADTTVSSIVSFFLAMTLYPQVQAEAQKEIDQIVGSDRLPTFNDRERLPYVNALVKEVLRWHPVAPMGLPHTSTEDDIYNGFLIPQGSLVFPNIWHFCHDPEVYTNPMVFNPERFLPTDDHRPESDPGQYVFGFGRRICPGRNLAENALFLNIAQVLAVFDIKKIVLDGKIVEPEVRFEPGVVSHVAPFRNAITPRSGHHEALIRSVEKIYPWQKSHSEILARMS